MPRVYFTDSEGAVREVEGNPGDSVMETAVRNGISGMALVLHCAGPFSVTAAPMLEACLRLARSGRLRRAGTGPFGSPAISEGRIDHLLSLFSP